MAENVDLIIFPEVLEGNDEDEVKQALIKTLKVDQEKVDEWFESDTGTIILHNVEEDVASRYQKAIAKCGAYCQTEETGNSNSLSLVPKSKKKNVSLFICPSCEHEEEFPPGTTVEQCPKCGLVIAKWEERMREEAEKEKIRRRLLRQQRLQEDDSAAREARMAELERLKNLEAEIMKELGIKPPTRAWLIFEEHTVVLSLAFTAMIVMLTGVAFFYVDDYLEQKQKEALAAEEASDEIKNISPVIGAAMDMQQTGNLQTMNEMSNAAVMMQGQAANPMRQEIVNASAQMMKGVDPKAFIQMASKMPSMQMMTQGGGGQSPMPVNMDTIGGVSGLQGAPQFTPQVLQQIAPPVIEDGRDKILNVMSTRQQVVYSTDNPDAPPELVAVNPLEEMDGSNILDLMKELQKDLEWDLFLGSQARQMVTAGDLPGAAEVANRIKNSVIKIEVLGEVMSQYEAEGNENEVRIQMAKIRLELDKTKDIDKRADLMLTLGEMLGAAGSRTEPDDSIARVRAMINDTDNLLEKSRLHARLATSFFSKDNKQETKKHFSQAMSTGSRLQLVNERISAFTNLAIRYYDVRNLTLANEILSEAEQLAAVELPPEMRSRVFAEIAMARGYMGDFVGADMAIENAAETALAKDQLLGRLAEGLIDRKRYYEALGIMQKIEDSVEFSRLEQRIISNFLHTGRVSEGHDRIEGALTRVRSIETVEDRGLLLGQLAKLAVRSGDNELGEATFQEALDNTMLLEGRKQQLSRGLVALERARVFHFYEARDIQEQLTDMVVKDPIGNEIEVVRRIANNVLPPDAVPQRDTPLSSY